MANFGNTRPASTGLENPAASWHPLGYLFWAGPVGRGPGAGWKAAGELPTLSPAKEKHQQVQRERRRPTPVEIRRGDIYLANLNPVIGSEQGGTRPVLVLQNDVGNKHSPTTIVAAI